jgi:toxin ParE1/3/4
VKIRYTLPALADLNSTLDYIASVSPHGARRVQQRIQSVIDLLSMHPEIGSRTDDPDIRRLTTLSLPDLLRDRERRDHHSRHPSRRPRSLRHAGSHIDRCGAL